MNDRDHGILCRYSDKTGNEINHFLIPSRFQVSAHISSLSEANTYPRIDTRCEVVSTKARAKFVFNFSTLLGLIGKTIVGKFFMSVCLK